MSKDQGEKKGQGRSDATVQEDGAIPAKPTALSDKDLEKVAGGISIANGTNATGPAFRLPNTFTKNK